MEQHRGIARLLELFEDSNGLLSMTRTLMFMSWVPATIVLVNTTADHIETVFGIYVGAYVLGYMGGKGWEVYGNRTGGGSITESVQVSSKSNITTAQGN